MSSPDKTRGLGAITPWLFPIVLVAAWQASASFGWLSSRILPAPFDVLKAFWALARSPALGQAGHCPPRRPSPRAVAPPHHSAGRLR